MVPLSQTCNDPFLFIAKGVFMYPNRTDVKSLLLEPKSRFLSSELVCDVFNDLWLKKPPKRLVNLKMRGKLVLPEGCGVSFWDQRG